MLESCCAQRILFNRPYKRYKIFVFCQHTLEMGANDASGQALQSAKIHGRQTKFSPTLFSSLQSIYIINLAYNTLKWTIIIICFLVKNSVRANFSRKRIFPRGISELRLKISYTRSVICLLLILWPLQSGPICGAQGRGVHSRRRCKEGHGTYCRGHSSNVASPYFNWGNIGKKSYKSYKRYPDTFYELEPPGRLPRIPLI